ncbi:hypothetical protein LguiA_023550 [Lonicera macranthoides]
MYKNQLQELAQRSCFNLPSYTCIREGPDHAPRFKAVVNFNGESFESPSYCTTLRQAEHSAAEVALNAFASRGPSNSLAARILDETGVYKNLLQEVSQRVGASLPTYTTFRSGLGHLPVFSCIVELAGIKFTGEPAKNKKQAEKNAAMAAWLSLKILTQQTEGSSSEKVNNNDEQEHVTVARALQKFLYKARMSNVPFPIAFPTAKPRPSNIQPPPSTSRILPLICPKTTAPRTRPIAPSTNSSQTCPKTCSETRPVTSVANDTPVGLKITIESQPVITAVPSAEGPRVRPLRFPAAGAAPYIPVRHFRPHHHMASPVTIRNAIPVFSAPPRPPPSRAPQVIRPPLLGRAPPVCVRQAVPVFAAPPPVRVEDPAAAASKVSTALPPPCSSVPREETASAVEGKLPESLMTEDLKELKI